MKKFRLYYDKDTETAWLQEMVNQGWALEHFALGVYTFTPCEPGEYIYQIDMLKSVDDFDNYRQFMEESGVEVVCRWMRWVFLREKAEDGAFHLYTDTESMIQHYSAIRKFFLPLAIVETVCAVIELTVAIQTGVWTFGMFTIFITIIAVAMFRVVWKCSWKIEALKKTQ